MPSSFSSAQAYAMWLIIVGIAAPFALTFIIGEHDTGLICGTILTIGMIIFVCEIYRMSQ